MADVADAVLVVDKPAGITSHDVVSRVRRWAGTRRVGHAGTLDPMATGVLVLGIGRATRLLTYLVGLDKQYLATIRLGVSTVTDDADGQVTGTADAGSLTAAAISTAMAAQTGDIDQVPSAVSAIKVAGKRAYARVRDGQEVQLAARRVRVDSFELLARRTVSGVAGAGTGSASAPEPQTWADLDVATRVSSGTYVRALARDLGAALGVGGHLTALRRTAVGPFTTSLPLDDLPADGLQDALAAAISGVFTPAAAAASVLAVRHLDTAETTALGYGRPIAGAGTGAVVAGIAPEGTLVAVLDDRGDLARPLLVLAARG